MIKGRRLEWPAHVACMPDLRIPKQVFFWMAKTTLSTRCPKRRWKNVITQDIGVDENKWYDDAVTCRDGEHYVEE